MVVKFTGQKAYTTRKLRSYHARGYAIIRTLRHPDGKETYIMEYIGKK